MEECIYKHSTYWFACTCQSCLEERKLAHAERVSRVRDQYLANEAAESPLFLKFQQPFALFIMSMMFLCACFLQAFYGPAKEYGDVVAIIWTSIVFFTGIYLLTGALFCFHMVMDHPVKVLFLLSAGISGYMSGYGPAVALLVAMVPIILTLTRWDELGTLFGLHVLSLTFLIISVAMFANSFGISGTEYQQVLLNLVRSLKI